MKRDWTMLLFSGLIPAWTAVAEEKIDFNRQIRPLISNHCVACHGPDDKERKADLRLDTVEGATADLGGYAAVVPGKPDESEMLLRILSEDDEEVMPPPKKGKRFTPEQADLIRRWISQGGKYEKHWSYNPPVKHEVPAAADTARPVNEIDRFLLARLEKEGLKPSPEADRHALARRLSIDLTGLPPAWAEVEAFVKDASPDAYGKYVAALLAKPAFGEHWAQMWLDLARYADSSGYPSDQPREIWGYRDWVIGALNRNLPFDRFTIEQLAGDLLPNPTEDQLVATAFHRNTMTQNEGGTSDEEFRNAAVIDRVNTTMAVWMGTTMACAQCHTHKFDPITQHEYFSVYAILNQSADADRKDETPVHSFFSPDQKAKRAVLEKEIGDLEKRFTAPDPAWLSGFGKWDAEFPRDLAWQTPKPDKVTTIPAGVGANIAGDGVVTLAKMAEKASQTVEIPLAAGPLGALRLETRPAPGFGNFVLTGVKAEIVPPANATGPRARHVRIELPGKARFLQLAEVEVFGGGANVALKGKASHSSQYMDAAAARAIDGRTDGDYAKGSVSHTNQEDNPWWEVDLGAEMPVDRIVVWNRTDGGTAIRLERFSVIALDEKRVPVWKQQTIPAPKDKAEFALGGPQPLTFAAATADHEQSGFPAASLVNPAQGGTTGWAVGGAADRPHELLLTLSKPVTVAGGSKLRVTLEQQSAHAKHVLGSFRIGVTGDTRVARRLATPPPVLAALLKPAAERGEAERKTLTDHYVRNIASESAKERARLAAARKELEAIKPATVPVMQDLAEKDRRETKVQLRGNWQNLGDVVTPAVPAAFHPFPDKAPKNRLGLGQWLVSRDNPLTARVVVNRFWEAVFGTGIVRTSEEFGSQGELPVHPELLDWLAVDFMEHGWDVKRLLTQLVSSRAYRQESRVTPELEERDPDNRFLARGPRFRPSGELLRDQALATGGILSAKMGGPGVRPMAPNLGLSTAFGRSNDWTVSEGEDRHRRSVYTEVRRNGPYAGFATFDAPNREVCTIRRGRTNTPLQAFVTMNDPVFVEAAQAFARRLAAGVKSGDPAAKVRQAYRLALSREADESEVATLTRLHGEALSVFKADPEAARKMATEPIGPAPEGADLTDLAAWTTAANVIMNLDEFLMRR
jgi:mono/diheme cytochrome c family protein